MNTFEYFQFFGCDIHLRLERKLKKDKVWNEYYTEKAGKWKNCYIFDSVFWFDN